MKCPYCQAPDSRVTDSREISGGSAIRRRRECPGCGRRFTTFERIDLAGLVVVKKTVAVRNSIPTSCGRNFASPLPNVRSAKSRSIKSSNGSRLTCSPREKPKFLHPPSEKRCYKQLKQVDHVAYIRFASVYREFADLQDLKREVDGLSVVDGS